MAWTPYIMSDLSKAFDCLPHSLLLEKLRHYHFGDGAIKLLESYRTNRFQRVKLSQAVSSWAKLNKGIPQGSVIGPQCFNVYINDLLLDLVSDNVIPSNYADDNSSSVVCDTKATDNWSFGMLFRLIVAKWTRPKLKNTSTILFFYCPPTQHISPVLVPQKWFTYRYLQN